MLREKIKGRAASKKHDHKIKPPDFYKEMGNMTDHHFPHCSERRDFATMAKPVPSLAAFSGVVTAKKKNAYVSGRLDSLLDMGEQKVFSSSSVRKKESYFCSQ
jgi:hypothetical protein